jgi:ABC-type multidrug transport system fused ATPase/permease subunit
MGTLRLDLSVPLRAFELALALEAEPGAFAVVGPSGAGKTTLLRAIAGLSQPRRGRIAVAEDVWFDAERRINVPPDRRSVGFVFQHYALFPHLTVAGNVAFGGARRVTELLERLAIAHLADVKPGELSGGERQRVALARAFLADAPILILDEATSSLDSESEALVQDAMHALMRGRTTLVIAHRLSTVRELDRILVFDQGRVVEDGNHSALLRLKDGIYRRLVEHQAEGMGDGLAAA